MYLNATQTQGMHFLQLTLCFLWLCMANEVSYLFHAHTHAFMNVQSEVQSTVHVQPYSYAFPLHSDLTQPL